MSFLEKIDNPEDLKKLELTDLKELSREIRNVIIDTVSKNGGHLASSLGAVELAIAIHYVFNVPVDKLIWDVGHQAYAHKLLTGRKNNFNTLRQLDGISGFPKISESKYDNFTTGHSSTSISAGYGMACAKSLKNDPSKVISVIGDGSLTGGIAYEGLNQSGGSDKNFLVILNDNEMSISENVGALSSFLSRTFSIKYLQDLRNEFKKFFKSLPKIGDDIYQIAKKSEESFKTFVTPGMLFEAFDFAYFGPINGHNLNHLIDILENIKNINKPVLLHVTTKKGKGYKPAEDNPIYFHGVGSFEKSTGASPVSKIKAPSYTEVFGNAIIELAEKNDKITAVTAAMPEGTGLSLFAKKFPERFHDVGIAEQHGITFAAGLATEGMKPVVAIYSTFLQRAYDQIIHDVCIENLPVVFAVDRGGIVGEDGPTHHGLFDYTFLRSIPNLVLMAPKNEQELRDMLYTAIEHNGPVAVRYPRGKGEGVPLNKEYKKIEIGRGEIVREGKDLLIIAVGSSVNDTLKASEEVSESSGIEATVINARYISPLDSSLIADMAAKFKKIITVEENVKQGGFGSAVLECLCDNKISDYEMKIIAIDNTFVEHGDKEKLKKRYNIDVSAIKRGIEEFCGNKS